MKSQLIFFITISVFAMIFCSSVAAENVNYNYTNDIQVVNAVTNIGKSIGRVFRLW